VARAGLGAYVGQAAVRFGFRIRSRNPYCDILPEEWRLDDIVVKVVRPVP
jgi:hypothetical protein